MWKIFIDYPDKPKLNLTGKHKDIPLRLAIKYYNQYAADRVCKAVYWQYPKRIMKQWGCLRRLSSCRWRKNRND